MQPFPTAKDEVFASGDLVYLIKDCFTKNTFALNKTFVRFAKRNQIDIRPVAVRANVNLPAYSEASHGIFMPFKICDIEWPARTDPTAEFDLMDFLFCQHDQTKFQIAVHRIRVLKIMTKMMLVHAPHLRRLKVHMSLNVDLGYDAENASLYDHINKFLTALETCTAIETLTIVQTDYVALDAQVTTVQARLFQIINTMQNLRVLDFNGNMTIEAAGIADGSPDTLPATQLTIFDYLPPSLRKLTIRDGPVPRMLKWKEFYGLSAGLKLVMSNYENRLPLLKKIYLPSSFWSLPPHAFGAFMPCLNARHVTHIGVSDAFKLKTGPTKLGVGPIMPLPAPYLMLFYLFATLTTDMVIDLRGGGHVERAARIQWVMDSLVEDCPETLKSHCLRMPDPKSHVAHATHATHATITMTKRNKATAQVLI